MMRFESDIKWNYIQQLLCHNKYETTLLDTIDILTWPALLMFSIHECGRNFELIAWFVYERLNYFALCFFADFLFVPAFCDSLLRLFVEGDGFGCLDEDLLGVDITDCDFSTLLVAETISGSSLLLSLSSLST